MEPDGVTRVFDSLGDPIDGVQERFPVDRWSEPRQIQHGILSAYVRADFICDLTCPPDTEEAPCDLWVVQPQRSYKDVLLAIVNEESLEFLSDCQDSFGIRIPQPMRENKRHGYLAETIERLVGQTGLTILETDSFRSRLPEFDAQLEVRA